MRKRRLIDNEDFWLGYLVALALCLCGFFVLSMLFSGCATVQGDYTGVVAEHSRNVGRLESTAGSLEQCISGSKDRLEVVSRASERIADGIERLEYLFSEYEREVDRLYEEIERLRKQVEGVEEGRPDRVGSDSPVRPAQNP